MIRIESSAKTAMTAGWGPWSLGMVEAFQKQKLLVDQWAHELKGKRVAMLPGGVGRLTAYARSLGIDAWCIDLSKICESICKKEYPEVPFLRQDFSLESDEWDAVFLEDSLWSNPFLTLKLATNWQRVCQIYPKLVIYKVVWFNSHTLDQQFDQPEQLGVQWFKQLLKQGLVRCTSDAWNDQSCYHETISIDLNQSPLELMVNTTPEWRYLGIAAAEANEYRLWCNGIHQSFATNQRWQLGISIPELLK